jgi:hypothetical protein
MNMNTHFWFDVFQVVVVATLVAGCTVYCLLKLAPKFIKQGVKQALLRCPLPASVKARLRQPSAAGACGSNCGACGSSPATPRAVKWHPRKP